MSCFSKLATKVLYSYGYTKYLPAPLTIVAALLAYFPVTVTKMYIFTGDPDRACRIACQDESVLHRFYLVNGEDGWFPFGTDCTKGDTTKRAFCIRGKCLVSQLKYDKFCHLC